MSAVYIISKSGKSLMPTTRYGHVRHLLKEGKAEIYSSWDIILFKGNEYNCHGCMSGGASVLLVNAKESPTGKAITVSSKKAVILKHINGWI